MIKQEGEYKLLNKIILKRVKNSRTVLYRYYNPDTGELRYVISHRFLTTDSELSFHLKDGFTKLYSKYNHHIMGKYTIMSEETVTALHYLHELSINDNTSFRGVINPAVMATKNKVRTLNYKGGHENNL